LSQCSAEEPRRLAMHGHRLGRRRLRDVATIVTPDTILRWLRQLLRTGPGTRCVAEACQGC
jgi:hypothetical protein